jgi:DNA-binding transcriptional ArsR family regulator
MVQYQELDRTFAALADPTRRGVVERLGRTGTATVSELAEPAGITLTGMKKHLRVLEDAGLVRTEKVGRSRRVELGPNRADAARDWLDDYRNMVERRFTKLDALLAREMGEEDDG